MNKEKTMNNLFDIADKVIEQAYPNFNNKERGWWGEQRIPNYGILRGSIATALATERKNESLHKPTNKTKATISWTIFTISFVISFIVCKE